MYQVGKEYLTQSQTLFITAPIEDGRLNGYEHARWYARCPFSSLKSIQQTSRTNLSSTLFDMDRQRNVENLRTSQALDSFGHKVK